MQLNTAGDWIRLAAKTLFEPKKCLRIILDIVITMPQLLQATVLAIVLSMIMPLITLMFQPTEVQDALNGFTSKPLSVFIVQLSVLLGSAFLIAKIGNFFNGHGTFKECLTAMVWLQIVMILVQLIQFFSGLISPQLSALIFLISVGIMLYLIVHFISELHGFTSIMSVLFGVIASIFGLSFIVSILLAMLGFTPEVIQNV